jgi:glyoxylase-like metal-dependent hydrolase (beta-lactamase superfamily II)
MPDLGSARADFPGGDARQLYRSIQKILSYPDHTRIFVCHDYPPSSREVKWATTVGEQKENNVHVKTSILEDEFVKIREARDKTLNMPKLIIPSIQVNMRAGNLPPPEDNGSVYIKVPINSIKNLV